MLAGIFFRVDQFFGQRPTGLQLRFEPAAIVIEIQRQLLLTADGDPQPDDKQGLGGEKNLQFQQVRKPYAHLTGNGDHHAAKQTGEHAALPAEFPRHHHVWQEHHNQQQAFQSGGEHHLRADPDDEKQAAPDDQRRAQGRIGRVQPEKMVAMLLA
ncbi:hypothetical protein D3C81_1399200 [compost metagenome]